MTPEQKEQLPELLRLTALALGDGWFAVDETLHKRHRNCINPLSNGDSRWLECELGIGTEFVTDATFFPLVVASKKHPYALAREQFNQHDGSRQAATCWAVLRCAAEIGRMKEKATETRTLDIPVFRCKDGLRPSPNCPLWKGEG